MAGQDRKKKKGLGRFLFGLTARTMMLMVAGVLILSYLSLYVNPAKAWFMTVFGLLFIFFFLANLVLLLWAAKRRSKAFVIPFLALLPSLFLLGRYVQFNGPGEPDAEDSIKVVSYNLGAFTMYPEHSRIKSEDQCRDSVLSYLRRTDADIICLQEFHSGNDISVKEILQKAMPGYEVEYYTAVGSQGSSGNVILSRFPVIRKDKFNFEESANLALYADIDTGNGVLRVYNCHFESYSISVPRLLKGMADKDEEMMQEAEKKIRTSITKRPEQVDIVLNDIKNSPVESIITGDFNDTPMSYTYTRLKQGRKDSFIEAGRGLGGTYSILWPFIRIDYILFPKRYDAVYHKVQRERFSDHYPIITELKLSRP